MPARGSSPDLVELRGQQGVLSSRLVVGAARPDKRCHGFQNRTPCPRVPRRRRAVKLRAKARRMSQENRWVRVPGREYRTLESVKVNESLVSSRNWDQKVQGGWRTVVTWATQEEA